MKETKVQLLKANNDCFREWIIEEWKHHNTVDEVYQLNIVRPEELKFQEKTKNTIKSYVKMKWLDL